MEITIKVIYFASVKDLIKKSSDIIKLSRDTFSSTSDLLQVIASNYSEIESELISLFNSCLLALDDNYIDKDKEITLKNNDEISIIPPISAG